MGMSNESSKQTANKYDLSLVPGQIEEHGGDFYLYHAAAFTGGDPETTPVVRDLLAGLGHDLAEVDKEISDPEKLARVSQFMTDNVHRQIEAMLER